jgi:hypothetical protein
MEYFFDDLDQYFHEVKSEFRGVIIFFLFLEFSLKKLAW